jgi:hypothetical protein
MSWVRMARLFPLKLPEKANAIIEFYRKDKKESYVFPYLKDEFGIDKKDLEFKNAFF